MNTQLLSEEYVKELNENPFVERVSKWTVCFTAEFKQRAYDEYINGKSIKEIFAEAGIDWRKLGAKRVANFRQIIVKNCDKESGFADKRKNKNVRTSISSEAQMAKQIRRLQHRIAYLEQENEYLKKIQEPEKEYDGKAEKSK